jgi:hypothetical protein
MNQKQHKIFIFYFLRGARPGTASGCFKKASETPNAGHPIWRELLGRNRTSRFEASRHMLKKTTE